MKSAPYFSRIGASITILSLLAACGDKAASGPAAGAAPPPPDVAVITIAPKALTLSTELPGRLEAYRVAQVRARVPGIVLQRVFKEGEEVKAGAPLFRIDPAPLQATYDTAQAIMAKSEANLAQANLKVQRYLPLVNQNAISRQEYDDAVTAQKQTAADLAAAKASRQTASLNLGYASVTAPIAGRIGRALVTEGALVGQGEATPLATIQQLNPIYLTLTQSSADILRLRRALATGQLKSAGQDQARITLTTEDGQPYPLPGKLLFSDLSVDESSGSVTLRAEFPNPDHLLLPGMYVRAHLAQAVSEQTITVPQQAVTRTPQGAQVMVVGPGNIVAIRPVTADTAQDNSWIITQGLKAGEQIIVEGFQKAKPGAPVKPIPWQPIAPAPAAMSAAASTASSMAASHPAAAPSDAKPKQN
jgi:membrane fusion protein (multidrug efflux system)